jgi:hypothetical protein
MMTTVRSAKSKGSQFEYDVVASLQQLYPFTYRTAELGFQRQYDVEVKDNSAAHNTLLIVECKRLKGISWNEALKLYNKLLFKKPSSCQKAYLLFQSNHQPCLVFFDINGVHTIKRFEDVFGVDFIKHKSTRAPKDVI